MLELDSTSLAQDTSSVEINFVPEFEEHLDNANLSQTNVFLEPHDYELFLLSQEIDISSDNLSHQEVIFVKIYAKMTLSSLILQSSGGHLHYPISWHNTTMRTRSPLINPVQFQPLPRLTMVMH